MIVGIVAAVLVLAGVIAVAYSNHAFRQWARTKDTHDRAKAREHNAKSLSDRLVGEIANHANDVMVGHSADYRAEILGLRADHERAIADISEVSDELIPRTAAALVSDVADVEKQIVEGTHVVKRLERERDVLWPAHVASYTDPYGTLDDLRRTGMRIADDRTMTAPDFRTSSATLVQLRSALALNIAQYEIDVQEQERNAKHLQDVGQSLDRLSSDIAREDTSIEQNRLAVVNTLSTSVDVSFTADLRPRALRIAADQETAATTFDQEQSAHVRGLASAAMHIARRDAANAYAATTADLASLVEQTNFNARIVELERSASQIQQKMQTDSAAVRTKTLSVGAERVAADLLFEKDTAAQVAELQRDLQTTQTHLLSRNDVIRYVKDHASDNLFETNGPTSDLRVGSYVLSDHGIVPSPDGFDAQLRFLQNAGLQANGALHLRNPVRFGDGVVIGPAAAAGASGLVVGGANVPVVFATDPWVEGTSQTLLQLANSNKDLASNSLSRNTVNAALNSRARVDHTHTGLLRKTDLDVKLEDGYSVSSVSRMAPGSVVTSAVGTMSATCLAGERQKAALSVAASNIRVDQYTFANAGDFAVPIGAFQDAPLPGFVGTNWLTTGHADASWIDFRTCPAKYFQTDAPQATAGSTPLTASVAQVVSAIGTKIRIGTTDYDVKTPVERSTRLPTVPP